MVPLPIDRDGRFCGYASVFGHADEGGDIVMPGSFAKTLARRGPDQIRLLFQHDPREPIGVWERLTEDGFGLWAEGRLVPGVPRADALKALIERRAIDGLSIGFRTVKATRDTPSGHRRLWQIELWEVSIVTFPMMDRARIGARPPDPADAALAAAISALRNT